MDALSIHKNQLYEALTMLDDREVWGAVETLRLVRNMKGTVYIIGNGGSAATASHFANDLTKIVKIKAVCLNDLYPVVSAYGNDDGWGNMFVNPLSVMFDKSKDCLVGLSCSGESMNVVSAVMWASDALTIGLTGISNSSLINQAECSALVHAHAVDIRVQEDIHMAVCHMIVRALQQDQ